MLRAGVDRRCMARKTAGARHREGKTRIARIETRATQITWRVTTGSFRNLASKKAGLAATWQHHINQAVPEQGPLTGLAVARQLAGDAANQRASGTRLP